MDAEARPVPLRAGPGTAARTGTLIAAVLAALFLQPADAVADSAWASYENPRFGFSFAYPADLFVPQPPPTNGDGREFRSPDGRSRILVFAAHNVEEWTPAGYLRWLGEGSLRMDR
jgi:hypothetical protein